MTTTILGHSRINLIDTPPGRVERVANMGGMHGVISHESSRYGTTEHEPREGEIKIRHKEQWTRFHSCIRHFWNRSSNRSIACHRLTGASAEQEFGCQFCRLLEQKKVACGGMMRWIGVDLPITRSGSDFNKDLISPVAASRSDLFSAYLFASLHFPGCPSSFLSLSASRY